MTRRLLTLLLFIGCGESTPPPSDGTATTPDVNTAACGSIGTQCTTSCPNGLECVNNACASVRGDCGGFAGAACQDTTLVCTYPQGSSAGLCMRKEEKDCLCAIAPSALGDCMQP
jgi:hypothetical protein